MRRSWTSICRSREPRDELRCRWNRLYVLALNRISPQFESEKALTQENRRAIKAVFKVGMSGLAQAGVE